ncbi:hypothetical protein T265_05370 [Opisthorchis viverrini]|uniref:Uncharacterized protein n=1 Tax=Opisthorchis viverrini TaxID=6198 RepID=A0A075AFF1_OPIVI|nr:hypothetical protein T265_05370 [Opisthorchis viverrini]KER27654.1 hypothetical protein T265_05370 [Opisthorchis viverrini]
MGRASEALNPASASEFDFSHENNSHWIAVRPVKLFNNRINPPNHCHDQMRRQIKLESTASFS